MSYGRRVLYTGERVRAMFARMRGDLHAQHSRHLCELTELRKELAGLRAAYEALRGAVLEREKAEANLELLRRDRERRTSIAEGRAVWLH
jgi:hypothetical protein